MDSVVANFESALASMKGKYDKGVGARDLLRQRKVTKEKQLQEVLKTIDIWKQVQVLLTKTSEYAREQLKIRIEETVTAALQAVFGEGLEFRIAISTFRDQPAAEWKIVSQCGDEAFESNPQDARGGGIVDIVSLALRLAMLELARPKVTGPIMLDEPGKMISKEFAANMAFFLKEYAVKTKRQIVLITHNEELAAMGDKTYQVVKNNLGESVVTEVG